nr:hypothetical protein [Tanacetum cinerariifolium]
MALDLMAKAFKLNYSTPTNNNKRISSNPRDRQIAQPGMNMGQDRQMQMVGGNANQNENGNLVVAHAEENAAGHNGNQIRCYNCRGVGHFARYCTVRPKRRDAAYLQAQLLIAQKEEAGIQLQAEEFDLMVAAADLDEIEEVNANCILMANLQQASTSEEWYTELLEPIPEPRQVPQNDNNVISEDSSVEQSGETVEQHPANVQENMLYMIHYIKILQLKLRKSTRSIEAAKFVGDFKSLSNEANGSLAKHKALELQIERLLRAVDTACDTSANTKFAKKSILGKLPKVGETLALSKPVTSNSIPTPQESKVMKNVKLIAPGMFRINPFKPSREEKHVPNKVRASIRTNPITVSQPPVITKKAVNSDSNGLSST